MRLRELTMSENSNVLKKGLKLQVEFNSTDPLVLHTIFQKETIIWSF